jgi:hypothetical protein
MGTIGARMASKVTLRLARHHSQAAGRSDPPRGVAQTKMLRNTAHKESPWVLGSTYHHSVVVALASSSCSAVPDEGPSLAVTLLLVHDSLYLYLIDTTIHASHVNTVTPTRHSVSVADRRSLTANMAVDTENNAPETTSSKKWTDGGRLSIVQNETTAGANSAGALSA